MPTVLVVEDERKIRDLLRSYLEHAGFTVLSTWSGGEATTLVADAAPDLVVLDLRLPDVPGEEVARELRRASAVPILVLTAKTDTDGERPQSYGAGELVLDHTRHQAAVRGRIVDLTNTEWLLLTSLAAVPGRVYSRYELINRTRGYDFEGYERAIDSHIRNLRHKIEADHHHPHIIQTVIGAGYRLGLRHDSPNLPASTA